jgi:hypothetical protein
MSDKVKQVAERILERTKDQIGTHSTNCHEYHLECFAAFVLRHHETAQSAPLVVESREALVRAVKAEAWDEGMAYGVNYDLGDREVAPEPIVNPYRTEGGNQ